MGYTHYWRFDRNVSAFPERKEGFALAVETIRKVIALSGVEIYGWDGHGDPEISDSLISLNGCGDTNEDHESFVVELNEKVYEDEDLRKWQSMRPGFGFCKTARKHYDLVVCCSLIALSENIEGFKVSSDGEEGDWSEAFEFYAEKVNPEFDRQAWTREHIGSCAESD